MGMDSTAYVFHLLRFCSVVNTTVKIMTVWRRLHLIAALQYLKGSSEKIGEGLFTRACRDRTRSNDIKLKEGRFRSDIRKKFCTMRVVRHWKRFPREAVAAPSLAVFKDRLDGALSNLV